MKSIATRSIATVAIMAILALATPLAAFAGNSTRPTGPTRAISALHVYQVAERHYRRELKGINHTFIAAIKRAKANYVLALSVATNSTQRITARAGYKLAIAEATVARANALGALGNPPVKPRTGTVSPA